MCVSVCMCAGMPPGHQWSVFLSLTLPYTSPINPQHITLILTHAHTHTQPHHHTHHPTQTTTPNPHTKNTQEKKHTHTHTHTHTHSPHIIYLNLQGGKKHYIKANYDTEVSERGRHSLVTERS